MNQLTLTNFSSACEVMQLLKQLGTTFNEFKEHETIENKYIMQKLQHKLQQLSITNNVVCNCHKDYKLSQMLQLLEDGLSKCSKTDQDRLNYGLKLRMALDDFTKDFIPHMQEEEEILQPLLVEHFSYEELKEIQTQVIDHHTHLQEHKVYVAELYQSLLHDNFYGDTESKMEETEEKEEKEICDKKETLVPVESQLPDEVWLQIFSFLNPLELMYCSKMSVNWNRLTMDPSLWTVMNPTYWARGFWTFKSNDNLLEEVTLSGVCPRTAIQFDEDADIDESANASSKYFTERKFIASLSESPFLERIGHGVQKLDLAYCHGVTDDVLREFLSFCPNLEFLDISQTKISDKAFKSLGENGCGYKLQHLDFTGCINITDKTLKKISLVVGNPVFNSKSFPILKLKTSSEIESCPFVSSQCGMQNKNCSELRPFNIGDDLLPDCCIGCNIPTVSCPLNANKYENVVMNNRDNLRQTLRTSNSLKKLHNEFMSFSDFLTCDRTLTKIKPQSCQEQSRGLTYLNLSGCFHITNEGLRALSIYGKLSNLTYLDLSGCLQVSGDVLEKLVESCPKLQHENLFYCDNISNDPYEYTASGCQNLQCSNRVCCRNGE
ncbi:F-box/LRR-repeat protein 5 isoform X2 [Octopus sinensis]|uniref:F-box/LRR-repeat protein 5 isoform X2 n=1 Tax=Octopus sinensis TaxID=2607531 RepID=A0A7E6F5T8_9MOLL|nr:F-box/LRR-repeat protein 5 isoform X2 [Octopus sinensis]